MDLVSAVEKTIAYGKYFNFPMSPDEVCLWLISPHPTPSSSIKKHLSPLSSKEITLKNNLLKNTREKEIIAQKILKITHFFPGIRLIALTGSVSANNSRPNDDLDLLIITAPHTLWLVRPFFLWLLSTKFKRRHPGDSKAQTKNSFCPNLWLDTTSLAIPQNRRNLYTAHEILQIKPLLDRQNTYQSFLKANRWTSRYLANAYQKMVQKNIKTTKSGRFYRLFAPLNLISFFLQYLYMRSKITSEFISLHSAFFHKNNPASTLTKYLETKTL